MMKQSARLGHPQMERFIDRAFPSPAVGPRCQTLDWPFYRCLSVQPLSRGWVVAIIHTADSATNRRSIGAPKTGIELALAVLLDGYPFGPMGPTTLRPVPLAAADCRMPGHRRVVREGAVCKWATRRAAQAFPICCRLETINAAPTSAVGVAINAA